MKLSWLVSILNVSSNFRVKFNVIKKITLNVQVISRLPFKSFCELNIYFDILSHNRKRFMFINCVSSTYNILIFNKF